MAEILGTGTKIIHGMYGTGIIVEVGLSDYTVWIRNRGEVAIPHNDSRIDVVDKIEDDGNRLTLDDVKNAMNDIFENWNLSSETIPLGDKWKNGKMILKPGDESMKSKEIPIETFFHKIVMVRDRIRVMEQRINANKKLSDEEKVDLQQYITRIYGSLTTFNVLFKLKDDHFVGERSASS